MQLYLNPQYVLAPFYSLLKDCSDNVLLGLRIVENIDRFPDSTPEELQFVQFSMGGQVPDIVKSRSIFKKWVLRNGFEDIHKCFRLTLERLYVFLKVNQEIQLGKSIQIEEFESVLKGKANALNFPDLIGAVNTLFPKPLDYQKHILSFNNARNCLVHADGSVHAKYCNNAEKDKLLIYGSRVILFFEKDGKKINAELGKPGPENAGLFLGAEEFQFEFTKGEELTFDLKRFLDILNTCIFVKADIEEKLKALQP